MAKFITRSIGCLLWPPFYFLPGILAGAMDTPAGMQAGELKWLLLATADVCGLVAGCAGGYGAAVSKQRFSNLCGRLLWLTPLIAAIGVVALVVLIGRPLMPVYIDILRKVVEGVKEIVLCGLPDATLTASYQAYKTHYP